ncbi:MAG: HlyD family efflux transporter periplasmic adaptor subunit [Flavobacterium sp.]|nr:MAG: HlyD family efflux transporter periplasmic adaptor subunit [Flavobacterium sp.]
MPNTSLRSEDVQEILTDVPNWMIRWGNLLILIFVLGLLAISWFVKYPDVIASQAMVTTRITPQKEFAQSTGLIDTIFVDDGELVYKDSPLAILENTANFQDVFFLKSIIDTLRPNNSYFEFPIDKIPLLFLGDIETDYALFENSYLEYLLNKQLQPYSNEAIASKVTISELKNRLQLQESQKKLNAAELSFQKGDLARHKALYEKGVISLRDFETKQAAYLQAERNFNGLDASISQLREAIGNARTVAKGASINQTKDEIVQLKNVIQSFNQLKRAIRTWEMQYVLSSKIDGRVSFFNYWSKNQNVEQGDLVFTIIPVSNKDYIAKLKTPAQNSGKIKTGQLVRINLENYPETEFGTLEGRIESISVIPDSDGYYLIDVALPEKLVTSYDKEINFKHEMRGAAEIITEDLRLFERFFYRLRGMFSG